MLHIRCLRIYRPAQHQMQASVLPLFQRYFRNAPAGFQRILSCGVFHQVGDTVPGRNGIRSRPIRGSIRREGVLHPLVVARQFGAILRYDDKAFLFVGRTEAYRSGPSVSGFVFLRRQNDCSPADSRNGGGGNPVRTICDHPAQSLLFRLHFHRHSTAPAGTVSPAEERAKGAGVSG